MNNQVSGDDLMKTSVLEAAPFDLPDAPTKTDLVAKYFRGFGDPTRLRILQLLRDGERPVGEVADHLGVSQPHTSNHLACLRWGGFVKTRRDGTTIFYSVADKRVTRIVDLTSALLDENEEHVEACTTIDDRAVDG